MEKRMFALESVVEKNTKMVERLDRSMDHLTQSMADLRLQMSKGFADVRFEMMRDKAELRRELTAGYVGSQNHVDSKFFCLVALHFIIAFTILGFLARDFIDFYLK
jgi:hypothetical protein